MAFNDKKLWQEWIASKKEEFNNIGVRYNKGDEMSIYPKGKPLPVHYPFRFITRKG